MAWHGHQHVRIPDWLRRWQQVSADGFHQTLDYVLQSPCPGCGLGAALGHFCTGCTDDWLMQEAPWCARCRQPIAHCQRRRSGALEPISQTNACRRLYYVSEYAGPPAILIRQLKYHRNLTLIRPFGRLMLHAIGKAAHQYDTITWMPLHGIRRRTRGFNQSELLARAIGRQLGLPARPLLHRRRHTPPLEGLSRTARHQVLDGALAVSAPPSGHILLVDDVFTTGASLNSAADALVAAGASRVDGAVLGRTPLTEDIRSNWLTRSFDGTPCGAAE